MANYYLKPLKPEHPVIMADEGVITIGRSESCDYTINNTFLSYVHSSLTVTADGLTLTDLESTNGTYLNEAKISSQMLNVGDIVRFGSVRYEVLEAETTSNLDKTQEIMVGETQTLLRDENVVRTLVNIKLPGDFNVPDRSEKTIIDLFPQFEFTEFIFEEKISGKAFDFEHRQPSLEISALFSNFIYEIKYFLQSEKKLIITNQEKVSTEDKTYFYLPLLELESDVELIEVEGSTFKLKENGFFDTIIYRSIGIEKNPFAYGESVHIQPGDVAELKRGNVYLYLKPTDSPPKTLPFGFWERDAFFATILGVFFLLWLGVAAFLLNYEPKVTTQDKLPEKIDRILYKPKKKPPVVEEPMEPQQVEDQSDIEVQDPNPSEILEKDVKKQVLEGIPKESVVAPKNISESPTPADKSASEKAQAAMKSDSTTDKTEFKKVTDNKKVVKTSENAKPVVDPANRVRSMTNKFQSLLSNIGTNVDGGKGNPKSKGISQTKLETVDGDKFVKARKGETTVLVGNKIGNLGNSKLSVDDQGGVLGFSDQAGRKTVVLGSMDPRIIQNVLKKHIPRFSYCYERELERINKQVATTMILKFTITGQGRPVNYSFTSENVTFSSEAIKCLSKVISTIRFPKPKGGGIVKVRQPMNMEPKY